MMAESTKLFLTGDFNINLMKIDNDFNTSNVFDSMTSKLIVHHIIYPTPITPHSKTLINNIFSKSLNSGNLALSNHLAQFLIIPMDYEFVPKNVDIYTKHFDRENFVQNLIHIN